MINNTRREFEERHYIEAAFFLQVPAKKLRTLHITPVTPMELSRLNATKFCIGQAGDLLVYHNDKFYYRGNPDNVTLLCSAYVIAEKQVFQLQPMLVKIKEWHRRNENIRNTYQRHFANLRYDLDNYGINVPTFRLQNFSIKTINKVMAKHKGSAEFDNEHLKLTFNKVKCGNEIEGYINYKSITVFLPLNKFGTRNLNAIRMIYAFQKFAIDTKDHISGIPTLHPHVSGWGDGGFCWGNRDNDWDIYAETSNIPFMIDVIYESLNTFNPGSPYIHVNTLINVVKTLNVVYKDYKKMNPASTPDELASHIFKGVNKCRKCDTILGTDGVCFVNNCMANPNAEITCKKCGVVLQKGEWDGDENCYKWICRNTSCVKSPDFIRPEVPGGIPICRICGGELVVDDENSCLSAHSFNGLTGAGRFTSYHCDNNEHGLYGIWQMVRNNETGALIDLMDAHYTQEFRREIASYSASHPTVASTSMIAVAPAERSDGGTVEEINIDDL